MALICCSNCGAKISDKAITCPKCGASNVSNLLPDAYERQASYSSEGVISPTVPKKRNYKKLIIPIVAFSVVIAACVSAFFLIPHKIKVKELEVSWTFDTGKETYTGTVTSDCKKPFIAVISAKESVISEELSELSESENESTDSDTDSVEKEEKPDYATIYYYPVNYVYVKDGEGKFELSYADPFDVEVTTYITGDIVDEDDFVKIDFDYTDFDDRKELKETFASFYIDLQMKENKSGVLFYRAYNTLTEEGNIEIMPIVNGKGMDYRIISMPYKSRDNNAVVIKDMIFVPYTVCDDNTKWDKVYLEQNELPPFAHSVEWTGEVTISSPEDGFLVYSQKLKKGENPKNDKHIWASEYCLTFMGKGISHISTSDMSAEPYAEIPEYHFEFLGYVPVAHIE